MTKQDATRREGRRAERGIALAIILAVLVCLLALAVPFSLSMRHEEGGATWRGHDASARRAADAVVDLEIAKYAEGMHSDANPWSDPPERLKIDLDAAAKSIGIDDLGPRGRLLSATIDDQCGRIDVNRGSLFLTARMLGLETQLARKLSQEDKEIRLSDGGFLQDEGFLWIDGEVTYYRRHEGATVYDFTRPAVVPGVWEPATLPGDAREFDAGTEVVDMRAWMVAAWCFKSPDGAGGGREARFESLSHPMAIASFGRGALGPEQQERLARLGTIWSADADRRRFGDAQRVLTAIVGGTTREVRLEQGHFCGPGTLARITTYDGKVDYCFVRRVDLQDDGLKFSFEMPLLVTADPGQAVAEFLLPRPVNANSCSKEVLQLLMSGLRLRGHQVEVDDHAAETVADRIIGARPLGGLKDLVNLLEVLVEKDKVLKDEQRTAILVNAEDSGSIRLEWGTAPFCWASDGVLDVRAAASLNYPMTGREMSRALEREVVSVGGTGRTIRVFSTQRDFEEPWRVTRMARSWTTFPENLDVFDGLSNQRATLPPSRLPAMLPPVSRSAAEDLNSTGARLAPAVLYGNGVEYDKTFHFDGRKGDLDSADPDGWRVSDGPVHVPPSGSDNGVLLVTSINGGDRPRPFGVSLWWNPGKSLGTDSTLFDWRCNNHSSNPDYCDRVRLWFHSNKLEFEVDDAFRRDGVNDLYTSKVVYDFTDGLALEGNTWYHVTAFCRGDRGGQMCLWVDGRPRGKWSHLTRSTSDLDVASKTFSTLGIDGKRLADGTVKFPTKGAVRVGQDVLNYTGISGSSLSIAYDPVDHFGGVRPEPPPDQTLIGGSKGPPPPNQGPSNQPKKNTDHPPQSTVELYGYSARLASDIPQGSAALDGDGLGKYGVAMLDVKSAKTEITISGDKSGSKPILLGFGVENTAQEIDLKQLDGNDLQSSNKTFQASGGFALIMGYDWGGAKARDPNDKQNQGDLKKSTQGSIVGGIEVIYYGAYKGSKLTNVIRGQGLTQMLGGTDFVKQNKKPIYPFGDAPYYVDKHAWLVVPNPALFGKTKMKFFTVIVAPISVRIVDAQAKNHFLVPTVNGDRTDTPELLQIDSNFSGGGKGDTEWVRYNSIVMDQNSGANFLRSAPEAISYTRSWLQGGVNYSGDTNNFDGTSGNQGLDEYREISLSSNGSGWAPDGDLYKTFIDSMTFEHLDPNTSVNYNRLAFRGVLGTKSGTHGGSAKVYPVFRTTHLSGGVSCDALPGRYDEVTVAVPGATAPPDRYIINYAWCGQYCEGWQNYQYSHVALLAQELNNRVVATQSLGFNLSDPTGVAANLTYLADSRNFARLLKHPSGELPSLWDGVNSLAIGGDSNAASGGGGASTPAGGGGGGSGGDGAKVDEVRVFGCADPETIYPQAMWIVSNDITTSEDRTVNLYGDSIRVPLGTIGGVSNGNSLHSDACVLQIGDDFLIGTDRTAGLPMTQNLMKSGRNFFATDPGYHSTGDPVQVLPWLVMSRLSSPLSADEPMISIADGKGFPRRGNVLIDHEILGYTDLSNGTSGTQLYCPSAMHAPTSGSTATRGIAIFRGRFGTGAETHANDAVVFWWPNRYEDGYATKCDIPEMATLEIPVAARRALFHSVTWREQTEGAGGELVLTARVQGRGHFASDPETDPDLFVFDKAGTPEAPNKIDRQGDLLLLRFNVRYRAGALDTTNFSGNGWKRAPLLQMVGVDYVAEPVVELHEEAR